MSLVFACIAPHGTLAIPDACDDATRSLATATQRAMEELGRRCREQRPDVVVVATPHNLHVEGSMAVISSARVAGSLEDSAAPLSLECAVDRELALSVRDAMRAAGVSTVAVSFGGNDPREAVSPLDWGSFVPLWFMGARWQPPQPVVVMAPARDLDTEAHLRAGAAMVQAAEKLGRRLAFIASADHGHGHSAEGRYGYHPESKQFDDRVVQALREQRLDDIATFDPAFMHAAVADSWWQMLLLIGAVGPGARCELLAYEAPTYYGMVCAEVFAAQH